MTTDASSILPVVVSKASVRKRGKTILHDINLKLDSSGFTIVMGPNGSGKTTLLRMLHGLERPRDGSVDWSVSQVEARRRQSFVFQTPVLMRRSVLDNIAYPLILRNVSRQQARATALDWAAAVELDKHTELEAHSLSGGERQKLAIARALITDPEVLFLDEPTTNLDGSSMREIESIIGTANTKGTKIVMTTHDIGQARRLANDVLFINKGQICEHQKADRFFSEPESGAARSFLAGDIVE